MTVWNKETVSNIKGFSLIEISIVVLIVSVMASSALSILGKKNNAQNKQRTTEKLEFISRAIQVYFNENRSLPCPAKYNTAVTSSEFGKSISGGGDFCVSPVAVPDGYVFYAGDDDQANILAGNLPTVDLGIPPEYAFDEWGRRLTYVVDMDLTNSDDYPSSDAHIEIRDLSYNNPTNTANDHSLWRQPTTSEVNGSVVDCRDETGNTTISPAGDYSVPIPVCVAFLVISHGSNGESAVEPQGSTFVSAAYYGPFEAENSLSEQDVSFNDVFIKMPMNEIYDDDPTNGGYFDDIIVYREKEVLNNESD